MSETIRSPWTLEAEIFIDDADGETVCVPMARTAEGRKDRARLLAAAPELLEQLQALVGILENSDEHDIEESTLDACRAAIAKAEGK